MENRELFKQKVFFVDATTGEIVGEYENTYTSIPQCTTVDVPDELHRRFDYLSEPEHCPYEEAQDDDGDLSIYVPDYLREEISNQKKDRISLKFGPFFWVRMKKWELFRPDCDPAALARAFYVGVHNFLGDQFDPGKLGIKHGAKKVVKELSQTGLFENNVSPENFKRDIMWRGRIGDVSNGLCGKLFEFQYKSAIEMNGANKHRQIGRILQLLPFVHQYTNILCKGDGADAFDCGSQLTKKDVSDLLRIDTTHSTRLMNELLDLKFMHGGREYPVLYEAVYGKQQVFCIHPQFYYAANILEGDHIFVPTMQQGGYHDRNSNSKSRKALRWRTE